MTINILLCDTFPGLLPDTIPSYESLFIDLFSQEQADIEYKIYKSFEKEFPETLVIDQLYLIPGSMSGVYEEKEWIKELLAFIRRAADNKVPMAGICFGHQAIAQALGGKVEPAKQGWGVGIRTSAITHDEALHWFTNGYVNLHYNHHDQVIQLPPGAKRWAASDFCLNEGFIVDDHIVTFQGHPEYIDEYITYLLRNHAAGEPENVVKQGLESVERLKQQGEIAARWMLSLVK